MATDNSPRPEARRSRRRIMAFMQRELLSPEVIVDRDDDLLSGEILDSIGVMRLAAFVEEEFRVQDAARGLRDRELPDRRGARRVCPEGHRSCGSPVGECRAMNGLGWQDS